MNVDEIEKLLEGIENDSSRHYAQVVKTPRRTLAEFLHDLQKPRLRYAFVCLEPTQVMSPGAPPTIMWTNSSKYQLEFFNHITDQWERVDREVRTHDHSGPLSNTGYQP